MGIILADSAPQDIHSGIPMNNGDVVTGRYQPDGRTEDPLSVTAASPRTTFLANFNGATADGDWTFFIADQAGGEVGQLTSWSLSMTFAVVPEPSATVSLLLALAAGLGRRRR
jgi:subtilisin-like proprotein convertase family protein